MRSACISSYEHSVVTLRVLLADRRYICVCLGACVVWCLQGVNRKVFVICVR